MELSDDPENLRRQVVSFYKRSNRMALRIVGLPAAIYVWGNPGTEVYLLATIPMLIGAVGIFPRAMTFTWYGILAAFLVLAWTRMWLPPSLR